LFWYKTKQQKNKIQHQFKHWDKCTENKNRTKQQKNKIQRCCTLFFCCFVLCLISIYLPQCLKWCCILFFCCFDLCLFSIYLLQCLKWCCTLFFCCQS
jgi:hypothetical protein